MAITFETASIGDQVWCVSLGWGSIINIDHGKGYPICVEFDSGKFEYFTMEGQLYTGDCNQTLFWDEVKFEVSTKPLPKLNKDDCVEVWSTNTLNPTKVSKRHFSHSKDDRVFCFEDGRTSWTTSATTPWNHWRKPE